MRQALREDAQDSPCVERMKYRKRPKAKAKGKSKGKGERHCEDVGEESDQDPLAAQLDAEDQAIRAEVEMPEPDRVGRKGAGRGRGSGRGRSGCKGALPTENDSWLSICNMHNALQCMFCYIL